MNKVFDIEYSTQNRKEVNFLHSCGIMYSFVKTVDEISIYKYTKTKELFEALAVFYRNK